MQGKGEWSAALITSERRGSSFSFYIPLSAKNNSRCIRMRFQGASIAKGVGGEMMVAVKDWHGKMSRHHKDRASEW